MGCEPTPLLTKPGLYDITNIPHSYERALRAQPLHPTLQTPLSIYTAYLLLATGNVLVLSSMYALGVTGTYLGDYFGILMDEPVTGFPFNLTSAPMYVGSTFNFLGTALLYGRPAGLLLTLEAWLVYKVALRFEEYGSPFFPSLLFLALPCVVWSQTLERGRREANAVLFSTL